MSITPYVNLTGNAEEALEFYKSIFGGEVDIMRYAGSPAAGMAPPEYGNKVMHGSLKVDGCVLLMMNDATPDRADGPRGGFALAFGTEDESKASAVFNKLAEGGKIEMPLENTFWGAKFGMLEDKFGISWMVNCALQPAHS